MNADVWGKKRFTFVFLLSFFFFRPLATSLLLHRTPLRQRAGYRGEQEQHERTKGKERRQDRKTTAVRVANDGTRGEEEEEVKTTRHMKNGGKDQMNLKKVKGRDDQEHTKKKKSGTRTS